MNQSIRRIPMAAAFVLLIALIVPLAIATAQGAKGKNLAPPSPSSLEGLKPGVKSAEREESARIPGEYIVVFKASVAAPASLAQAQVANHDGDLGFVYRHALKGYSAELSKDAVQELREDPRVRYVAPNEEIETFAQTVPTGVERIEATKNALADIDGQDDARVNVDVAVIDTGVDHKHGDLNVAGRVDCSGSKCIEGAGEDLDGHGTHVAGTIGAIDNSLAVVGVAPGARIWSVRVFNDQGKGSTATIAAGIDWVTKTITDENPSNDIEVANMSVGCRCEGAIVENAISGYKEGEKEVLGMADRGVVPVVAAGNETAEASFFSPARNPDAITVAALADSDGKAGSLGPDECEQGIWQFSDDELAPFSNYGDAVDIAAPGMCILSTFPGTTEFGVNKSGTSMATPHVAGAAALLAAKSNPNSQADVEAIRNTLVQNGNLTWEDTHVEAVQEALLDVSDTANGTEAATGQAYPIRATGATLNGRVDPNGTSTSYKFEYGTTEAYGQSMPASPKAIGSGSGQVTVSEVIDGLKPETTYHFRIVATTSKGTINGADKSFKTSAWTRRSVPNPGGHLRSVACRNRSLCVAGGYQYYSNEAYLTEWNGKSWSASPVETSENGQDVVQDVECPAAWKCIAVGYSTGGSIFEEIVLPYVLEAKKGPPWSWQDANFSSQQDTWFNGVSCTGTQVIDGEEEDTFCMAVGRTQPTAGTAGLLSATYTSGNWKTLPTEAAGTEWKDVSCSSPTFCIAVGNFELTRWNGSEWLSETPAVKDGVRSGVSCPSVKMCMTVGSNAEEWIAELWDGTKWSQLTVPSSEGKERLYDVECVSEADCTATYTLREEINEGGGFFSHKTEANTLRWDGTKFTIQPSTASPKQDTGLYGLSCLPDSRCMAVGFQLRTNKYSVFGDAGMTESRGWDAPTIIQEAASAVSHSKATMNASVDPEGFATTYQFEYGTSTAYGSKEPASPKSIGSGSEAVAVSENLANLLPNTTYHYRVVASNSEGTSYGENQTFKTSFAHVPLIEAEKYPASIGGSQVTEHNFTLSGGLYNVKCSTAQFSASVSAASASLSLVPAMSSCKVFGLNGTWSMNSCSYKHNVLNSGPPYTATMDITCSKAEDEIVIANATCKIKIPAQSGLKGVGLANSGSGSERAVTVTYNITGVTYKKEGAGCSGGPGTFKDGAYTGSAKLLGLDGEGKADGIYLSGEASQGLFVTGKESGEEASKPKVEAEKYPASIGGSQVTEHNFTLSGGLYNVKCSTAQFSASVSAASASLSLVPAMSSCKVFGLNGTWSMNSCSYKHNVLNSGPPYTATMDITCSKAEDEIVIANATCKIKIPAQSGLKGVGLANSGSGSERAVTVTYNITGVTYKKEGAGCSGGPGTFKDGAYTGSAKLLGFQ